MAKLSKKAQQAFDQAVDHLGGGTPPVPALKRPRPAAKRRTVGKRKVRTKKR
jgi:hypothetical protein